MSTVVERRNAALLRCHDLVEELAAASGYGDEDLELDLETRPTEFVALSYLTEAAEDGVSMPAAPLLELVEQLRFWLSPGQRVQARQAARTLGDFKGRDMRVFERADVLDLIRDRYGVADSEVNRLYFDGDFAGCAVAILEVAAIQWCRIEDADLERLVSLVREVDPELLVYSGPWSCIEEIERLDAKAARLMEYEL